MNNTEAPCNDGLLAETTDHPCTTRLSSNTETNLGTTALSAVAAVALSACGEDAETTASNGDAGRASAMAYSTSYGQPTPYDAWRFLCQATMGPTDSTVGDVIDAGYVSWLNAQLKIPYPDYLSFTDESGKGKVPPQGTYSYSYLGHVGFLPSNTPDPLTTDTTHPFGSLRGANNEVDRGNDWERHLNADLWGLAKDKPDQLRQRVVHALAQFLVVSLRNEVLGVTPMLVAGYMDMLSTHAFGNFRNLIEGVVRSPAMGHYLSHMANRPPLFNETKTPPELLRIPDQNFARELLQLFTLGLTRLNMDGTEIKDAQGNPDPSTVREDIVVLSNVLTGWAYSRDDKYKQAFPSLYEYRSLKSATKDLWYWPVLDEVYSTSNEASDIDQRVYYFEDRPRTLRSLRCIAPMAPFSTYQFVRRSFANYQLITSQGPLEQTHSDQRLLAMQLKLTSQDQVKFLGKPFKMGKDPADSMRLALDRIFEHPNLAPFVAKQMIQHMVTSNPSPTYVKNVATAFKNSGWDMKVLIQRILLDTEARLASAASVNTFGRLKEPFLRVMQMMRSIGSVGTYAAETIYMVSETTSLNLNNSYMWAPSVFNDFSPRYSQPGGKMATAGKVTPQMQIATESAVVAYVNAVHHLITNGSGIINGNEPPEGVLNLKPWSDKTPNPTALVEDINRLLFGGKMSLELKALVLQTATGTNPNDVPSWKSRIQAAIFLAVVSTEFMVQR
jgi:uncharacterized protein (DUF1800 family)